MPVSRTLLAAFFATTALAGAAHAQSSRESTYDDGQAPDPRGYYENYSSTDARTGDAPSQHWEAPKPYARANQVDQGRPDDEAHRADRAYTADLNRRAYAPPSTPYNTGGYPQAQNRYRAQLAAHDQAMADYREAQRRYAERIAHWRARANACEAGDIYACQGPE
jgi:uncharacterized protein involved in copper resistance